MEILSCKGCGRLFNYIRGERLCDGCKKKLEDKFVVVKKYSAFCVEKSMSVTDTGLVHEYFILPLTFSRVNTN